VCPEPAIGGAATIIELGTPVRLDRLYDADPGRENYKDEQRKLHDYLLGTAEEFEIQLRLAFRHPAVCVQL